MATADPSNKPTPASAITVESLNASIANSGYVYYTGSGTNVSSGAGAGNVYYASGGGQLYVDSGTHWVSVAPTYTTTVPLTYTTTEFNGDITSSRIFQSMEEKIEYQQQAYREPRDHAFNPGDLVDLQGSYAGMCQDCFPHSVHRWDESKHLFVIDEEIDWVLRLAS